MNELLKITEKQEEKMETYLKEKFKEYSCEIKNNLEAVFSEVHTEIYENLFIHSIDLNINLQNDIRNTLTSKYRCTKDSLLYEFDKKHIRKLIFEENKELIIKELNQDLLEEIDKLKKDLKYARNDRY